MPILLFRHDGASRGGHWGVIPQYRKKKWQIPKYLEENRPNTDTAYFNYIYNRFRMLMVASSLARLIISGLCTRCPCFFLSILVVRKLASSSSWGHRRVGFPLFCPVVCLFFLSPRRLSPFVLPCRLSNPFYV